MHHQPTAVDLPVGTQITVHRLLMVKASDRTWLAYAIRKAGPVLLTDDAHGRTRPDWVAQWWLTHRLHKCNIELPIGGPQ